LFGMENLFQYLVILS